MREIGNRSVVPTVSAVFITIIFGVLAFMAGVRAQEYGLFDRSSTEVTQEDGSGSSALPDDLNYDSVEAVYDVLRKNYDGELSEKDLLDGLKSGLAQATGDPYTSYLNSDEAKEFTDDLNGTFSGIGAEIGIKDELLIIVAPLKGFPAEAAGLRSQDVILQIDEEDTFGLSIEQAVSKIRGPEDTEVKLTVLRDGERLEFTITRATIVVPSVEWEVIEGNIGLIELSRFAEDTNGLMNKAVDELQAQNVKGFILDIRNNSGGYLQASVDVSSLWIDSGVIVEQREGSTVTDSLSATGNKRIDLPTVVLINQGSASASEIVAGALQDYEKATLVGETNFGKGSVQSLESLAGGALLKVTIARWYTPNGNNIDQEGIKPDIEIERTNEDYENDRDPQLERAVQELQ